jgi:LuxR family transcriptional regulator, maltose regulon positive regulatory protein
VQQVRTRRPADCSIGDAALRRGSWAEARAAFETALAARESPEALEGLGAAAWWLDLADILFDARERAYRLYLDRGDKPDAARIAVNLAWDCWAFRGEHAVASGWLQRARRLLQEFPDSRERAWLEIREGSLALFEDGDPDRAHALAAEGIRAACAAGSHDLEMLGHAVQGLALVSSGAVAEGMRLLDEVNAAVVAGEMQDLLAIGLACCYMVAACDRVRDYDRALQWLTRLKAFCAKWGLRPLFAVCRTQYASICMWRGTWLEAEQELVAATDELAASRPAMTADGLVRLAELRRRQGRLVEAAELFEKCLPHPMASLGRGELAIERGDPRAAADEAERYLRRVPSRNRVDRVPGLDLLVRARTALGDLDGSKTALAEMTGIAAIVATIPVRAAVSLAAGTVHLADGDADGARRALEDAVDAYLQSGASFELATARVQLSRALAALGRAEAAVHEVHRAIDLFAELHAEVDAARARRLAADYAEHGAAERAELADGPRTAPNARKDGSGLTARELEVLRLVAAGLNNQDIAARLFLSDHTIHRHVANIFSKLSVSSRAAAVAQAARRGLL